MTSILEKLTLPTAEISRRFKRVVLGAGATRPEAARELIVMSVAMFEDFLASRPRCH